MYLWQVKKPDESKGKWDYYKLAKTIPVEDAWRPSSIKAAAASSARRIDPKKRLSFV